MGDAELKKEMDKEANPETLKKPVEDELEKQAAKKLKEKVDQETKKTVRTELFPLLKKAVIDKWEAGIRKKAIADVKKNKEEDLHKKVAASMQVDADKEV